MESPHNHLGKGLEAATYLIQVLHTEIRDNQQALTDLNNQVCRLEGNITSITKWIKDGEQSVLIKVTSLRDDVEDLENVLEGVVNSLDKVKSEVERMEVQRSVILIWLSRLGAIISFLIPLILTVYIFIAERNPPPPSSPPLPPPYPSPSP
jgi:uncharacterized protein YlxW (UPF0749 family)